MNRQNDSIIYCHLKRIPQHQHYHVNVFICLLTSYIQKSTCTNKDESSVLLPRSQRRRRRDDVNYYPQVGINLIYIHILSRSSMILKMYNSLYLQKRTYHVCSLGGVHSPLLYYLFLLSSFNQTCIQGSSCLSDE